MSQSVTPETNNKRVIVRIAQEFQPRRLIPSLTAGAASGIIEVVAVISLAALIYSTTPGFEAKGIGLALFGTMIIGGIVALTSSYPGMIAGSQDIPAAILSLVAVAITHSMSASATSAEIFATVVAAIVVSSLLTGLFFLLLGYLKLGGLIRFLPYPVVGGFLAGTGWLLTIGGIGVMTGGSTDIAQLITLLQPDLLIRWLPGLIFAVALLAILSRSSHFLIVPGMILAAIGLFYAVLAITNTPVAQVSSQGWLMGPFPAGQLWQPLSSADLFQVSWPVLLGQSGNIIVILMVSVVGLLLNVTGLELIVERDVDLNRELRAAGWGNLVTGLGSGIAGYQSLGQSALGRKIGSNSRLVGLVTAGVCGLTLLFGAAVLALMPRLVLGGLLIFLGLDLLREWVYRAWFNFSRIDYLIIITILVVIVVIGFLEGVALGIVLAVVLFVINYSRINVVKHTLSGIQYQSRVTRSHEQRQILGQRGDEICILQLQGFIFFGTANNLLKEVRQRIEASHLPRPRFVLLDFRQVTGLDSTALLSFAKMKQLAQTQHLTLVFTSPLMEAALSGQEDSLTRFFAQLERDNQGQKDNTVRLFSDLDHGLEWCENRILLAAGQNIDKDQVTLQTQLRSLMPDTTNLQNLLNYFERLEVGPGYYLMRQDAPPDDLYFIERGQVTAQLEFPDRGPVRLETMRGGRVVGEIGFYLNQPRTAAVVTDEASTVYRLSRQNLKKMEQNEFEVAFAFHQGIIRLLSERIGHLINSVNALQR